MSDWPRTLHVNLRFGDGDPVGDKEVVFAGRGSVRARTETDWQGRCHFVWPGGEIERVEVEGRVVAQRISVEGMFGPKEYLDDITIAKPEEKTDSDGDSSEESGLRGVLFYSDGTRAVGPFTVAADFANLEGGRCSTDDRGGYCKTDGTFYIPTGRRLSGSLPTRMYVDNRELDRTRVRKTHSGDLLIVLPAHYGKKGTKGGLITGVVVDTDGYPVSDAKVEAKVVGGGGILPFFGAGEVVESRTDNKGRFELSFTGGTQVKGLLIDGKDAGRVAIGRPGQETELPRGEPLHAGAFNLRVTRSYKGLFSFLK